MPRGRRLPDMIGFSSHSALDSHRWCWSLAILGIFLFGTYACCRWIGLLRFGNSHYTRRCPPQTNPLTDLTNLYSRVRTSTKLGCFLLRGKDFSLLMPSMFHLMLTRLSDDVLITHCASWLGHVNDNTRSPEFQEFPGTLTLWKWLGLRRFFPEGKEIRENPRGCAAVCIVSCNLASVLTGARL